MTIHTHNISAEYLRIHIPAVDSKIRSIRGEKGYALLCVGFRATDLEVETQDEDEVYWLQFGRYFARGPIERDYYALELAMGDE
ncbi:hypothetical protein ACS0TY_026647 [Phlomoides rotata]